MTAEADIRSKIFPEVRSVADLERKSFRILSLIPRTAKENGVFADFFEANDGSRTNPRNGLYFIVTPDWQIFESLRRNPLQFKDLLDSEKKRSPHMMNCYYNIVHLNDLSESTVFLKHQAMCKAIQDMAIVVNAFYEYGYNLPKQVHEQTVENFYDYNQKRNDASIPQSLRESYDKIMAKAVTDAYQFYSKQEALSSLSLRQKDCNRVSADYFIKNHIKTIYESIDRDFLDFIVEKMRLHPEFKYYRESAPDIKLRDISKISARFYSVLGNPLENKTAIERYNIGFPSSCEALYYGWMVEYNTRGYDKKKPIEELNKRSSGLLSVYITQNDMYNFNSLCRANNIDFAINTGKFKDLTQDTVRNLMVLYRMEDREIVTAILDRLGRERRGYIPVNSVMRQKAEENRPPTKHDSYIKDICLKNDQKGRGQSR